jgi:predicted dehydrogenase
MRPSEEVNFEMKKDSLTRREFMRLGAGAAAAGAAAKINILEPKTLWASPNPLPASETVRFGIIGTGIRGCELLSASLRVPGLVCVAAADLYDSRHQAAKEALGGLNIETTRDYRKILDRKDIDAVIIAATDHWHCKLVEDACAAGKDIYCEKPMSHTVEDGFAMIKAVQNNNRICQVGSQRVSSIVYAKAKEIYDSGKLGEVTAIEAAWDRNSDSGAWVYPIPPNASEKVIDWETWLGDAPKHPFDPVRFFRWRCFTDYGEGLGGDLFVHLISGIHFVSGTNSVAQRALSGGGLYYFKDGRDFPDLLWTIYDYTNFQMTLRCNLNNNFVDEYFAFYGKKGTMAIHGSTVTFKPQDTRPQPEDYSIYGWPASLRNQYLANWHKEHPLPPPGLWQEDEEAESYVPPKGYNDVSDHINNWVNSIKTRKPPVENEVFGNNAALGCHLSNYSYFKKTVANWDATGQRING